MSKTSELALVKINGLNNMAIPASKMYLLDELLACAVSIRESDWSHKDDNGDYIPYCIPKFDYNDLQLNYIPPLDVAPMRMYYEEVVAKKS